MLSPLPVKPGITVDTSLLTLSVCTVSAQLAVDVVPIPEHPVELVILKLNDSASNSHISFVSGFIVMIGRGSTIIVIVAVAPTDPVHPADVFAIPVKVYV